MAKKGVSRVENCCLLENSPSRGLKSCSKCAYELTEAVVSISINCITLREALSFDFLKRWPVSRHENARFPTTHRRGT